MGQSLTVVLSAARECPELLQTDGHFVSCTGLKFRFLISCTFICDDGFLLPDDGVATSECVSDVYPGLTILKWSIALTDCRSKTMRDFVLIIIMFHDFTSA